jgi:hypothetical protein
VASNAARFSLPTACANLDHLTEEARMAFEAGQSVEPASIFVPAGVATAALPPGVTERLLALREGAENLHRLLPLSEERHALNTEKVQATQRLARLQAPAVEGGFSLSAADQRVVQARQLVEELTAARDRLEARYETAAARWQPARRLVTIVEEWLRDKPGGTTLEDFDGPKPTLQKGEDILGAIERLRRRCRELAADLHRIESSCYPSAHAKAKMREQIEVLAARGAPTISLLIEHDREVAWAQTSLQARVFNAQIPSFAAAETADVFALIAWLHKDALIARLDREIDAEADDGATLSHADRERQAAKVAEDLLDAERQEAALVWRALEQGLPAEHRTDCSPQAILGCQLVTVPVVEPRGSSPERAGCNLIGGRRR